MRVDGHKVYIEVGDTVELYDDRGVSIGNPHTVSDVDAITVWPTETRMVWHYRVASGDGRSVVGTFDCPSMVRPGMYVTVDPMMRLPSPHQATGPRGA